MRSERLRKYIDVNAVNDPGEALDVKAVHYNNLLEDVIEIDAKLNLIEPTVGTTSVDTISERTSGAGVTVDGVLLKDGNVDLQSTDAGATAGPELTLYRNSATPTALDIIGQVSFDGEDSAGNQQEYARITGVISDPTSTSEDGQIDVTVVKAGVATKIADFSGTGLNITQNGTVALPALTIGGNADTGLYEVSGVQTGFSQDGTLVAAMNSGIDGGAWQTDYVVPLGGWGSTPVGTVSAQEYGDGKDMTTVLTLTDFIVGALDGAAAAKGVGNVVYAFPAGQHFELVYSLSSLVLKAAGTPVATDTGLGSVIASGVISALNGTSTFEDRLTGQTINTAAAGGAAVSALTAATAGIGTGISLNIAGSIKNVFLNSAGTWNADNTGNLTASGTIVLKWTRM